MGESFNGKLRDECLNLELFTSLAEARVMIGDYREHYNQRRPHSNLAYRSPAAFAACRAAPPPGLASLALAPSPVAVSSNNCILLSGDIERA